ncbi:hypothetical protein FJ365_01725 [Candidatus Dependentiae bacterium]|nr:hypothetical protein [Candidatus Dependentiae bacterium]
MSIYTIFTLLMLLSISTNTTFASSQKKRHREEDAREIIDVSSDYEQEETTTPGTPPLIVLTPAGQKVKSFLNELFAREDFRCTSTEVETFKQQWALLTSSDQTHLRTCNDGKFNDTIEKFLTYKKPRNKKKNSPQELLNLLAIIDPTNIRLADATAFATIWYSWTEKKQQSFLGAHEELMVLIAQLTSMIHDEESFSDDDTTPLVGTYLPAIPAEGSLEPRPLARGIENPHVMCFMNATLQGILASPRQVRYLSMLKREAVLTHAAGDSRKIPLLETFFDYRDRYFFTASHAVVPANDPVYAAFAHTVHTLLDPMVLRQHDPHEFYTQLFTALHKHGEHIPAATRLLPTRIETTNTCMLNGHVRTKNEPSYVVMLEGLNSYPNQDEPITITALLNDYQAARARGDQIECSLCGCENDDCPNKFAAKCPCRGKLAKRYKRSHDTMQYTIHPENHLVIYVQRANADNSKCKKPVIAEKKITVDGKRFQLMSVLFHGGNKAGGGHWTTLRKEIEFDPASWNYRNTREWIYCNDAQLYNTPAGFPVTITAEHLEPIPGTTEATMFFYERIH